MAKQTNHTYICLQDPKSIKTSFFTRIVICPKHTTRVYFLNNDQTGLILSTVDLLFVVPERIGICVNKASPFCPTSMMCISITISIRLWFDVQKLTQMGSSFINILSGWPSHSFHWSF